METGCLKKYLDFKKKGFNGAPTKNTNIEKTEQDTPAPRPREADLQRLPPRHTDTVREEGNNLILTTK
jgi:hypothetical protein